jgi:hypothetical protein
MGTVNGGFGIAGIVVVGIVMVRSAWPNQHSQISLARLRASSFTINLNRTCQK